MSAINQFCLSNNLRIVDNPCISPDFCLDWPALQEKFTAGAASKSWPDLHFYDLSRFAIASGQVTLVEDPSTGDHAWFIDGGMPEALSENVHLGGQRYAIPATWSNLLALKNLVQQYDPDSTIFPTARGTLKRQSIGVGARFTTLHWPAVEWAMAQLQVSLTANQNSIPRELVYDCDEMLADRLMQVRFPFIGGDVPEGHQGQSIEGMSHGAVISKLKTGFHRHGIPWGFNADHQPVGGIFHDRAATLVKGSILATYITFDLSPELMATKVPTDSDTIHQRFTSDIPSDLAATVRQRVADAQVDLDDAAFEKLMVSVWPAVQKMLELDRRYAAERERLFTTSIGRKYYRELSIDELPGLTTPDTLATMLALVESLGMSVQFVAPAFGFQKNFPFEDNEELERRIACAWDVCKTFGVSIGFHSGSGKSAENYQLCGKITDSNLEIKTSGRYTYEMGVALQDSPDAHDQQLWHDWYGFTRELALNSAFAEDETERDMARSFIEHALHRAGKTTAVFSDRASAAAAIDELPVSADQMFWFEYNFLYVLAANGSPEKSALGDHSPAGYRQRARFYAISDHGRLAYAKRVAEYLCFLCRHTGISDSIVCEQALRKLSSYTSYKDFLADIAPRR
ncbi:MAG: hypothetical protein EA401_11120 [Planctomycetota bacterium]|nr:MAG: hypothetical protein EA401_11120 [Planctomycetota bacterium]